MLLACPGEAGNQIRKLSTCATVSKGDFHVDSNSLAALDRRCLRRAGPGHYRIFTRRMSGFDCAGVYRRTVGLLDRRLFPSSGTLYHSCGWNAFSGDLVGYRRGIICGSDKFDQPATSLTLLESQGKPSRGSRCRSNHHAQGMNKAVLRVTSASFLTLAGGAEPNDAPAYASSKKTTKAQKA